MKVKMNLLIVAIILAMILFSISTYFQKKLIHYEPTVDCYILTQDMNENEMIQEAYFKKVKMPISIVATQKIVTQLKDIEGLYAKDNIKSGQIAMKSQFDTKENLSVYEAEKGKEKIAIKIKSPENGMSFQIKEKALVNIYATLRNEYANGFLPEKERLLIGDEWEGYSVIKIIEGVKILGAFTSDGIEISQSERDIVDSILISVTPEEAKIINLLRDLATFNVTGMASSFLMDEKEEASTSITISGEIAVEEGNSNENILGRE